MDERYNNMIEQASTALAESVLELEPELRAKAPDLDRLVLRLVRVVGRRAMEKAYAALVEEVTSEVQGEGLRVERDEAVPFDTVFGTVRLRSPYLRRRRDKRSSRPVREVLGITGRGRSTTVERALVDFGAEESFGQAAKRFEEHYGFEVGRTSVLRIVERYAEQARDYVSQRLGTARKDYQVPVALRPGVDAMLVELDGCNLRTGWLEPANDDTVTEVRELPRRRRVEAWREVRVGLARDLDKADPTYVARMASYPEVVLDLFSAATEQGMSRRTDVYGVGDGGNGLCEELQVQFPRLQYVLDWCHLKGHLAETALAMGLADVARPFWVSDAMRYVAAGRARRLVAELRSVEGEGAERAQRCAGYLERFADGTNYDELRDKGVPIGSGEVESAHRHIPQKRLKLPGAWWKPETVEPMLALRVMRANDWWDDFWRERHKMAA